MYLFTPQSWELSIKRNDLTKTEEALALISSAKTPSSDYVDDIICLQRRLEEAFDICISNSTQNLAQRIYEAVVDLETRLAALKTRLEREIGQLEADERVWIKNEEERQEKVRRQLMEHRGYI